MSFLYLFKHQSRKLILGLSLLTLIPNAGYAAFVIDQTIPQLSTAFYTAPVTGTRQHSLSIGYAIPGNMPLPTLQPVSTLRLKILLPPGTSQASIRAESNNWIGVPGSQPVIAVIESEVTESTCPIAQGSAFTCAGQVMEPPSGGLSKFLYLGNPLSQPRYVNFVLHNPGSSTFDFATLSISAEITNLTAYAAWLNKRPWVGTGNAGSQDGLSDTPIVVTPVSAKCDITQANVLATLNSSSNGSFTIAMPRIKMEGLPDMAIKMEQITDPNKPKRILFKFSDIQWLTCAQNLFN